VELHIQELNLLALNTYFFQLHDLTALLLAKELDRHWTGGWWL
jgi:hypothetical protein